MLDLILRVLWNYLQFELNEVDTCFVILVRIALGSPADDGRRRGVI